MNKPFSERYGHTSPRATMQMKSMDEALRNRLWNCLDAHCWNHCWNRTKETGGVMEATEYWLHQIDNHFFSILWRDYFNQRVDTLSQEWIIVRKQIDQHFFSCEWYEVYNFIEFIYKHFPYPNGKEAQFKKNFTTACNGTLEQEMSAYRLLDGQISPITNDEEITEIDTALKSKHESVATHLKTALTLLSDRGNPDYRNSIKESISAVESLVKKQLDKTQGTLGQLLDRLDLHPSMKEAFQKLYGYTSDAGGIRHGLKDDSNPCGFDEAKFMLVACSAFINFVQAKQPKI